MREQQPMDRSRLVAAALHKIPCDLTVENIQFVNMFTGEIYPASVDVLDGRVVRVREGGLDGGPRAHEVYDGGGAYLTPGFIDAHMHVESTMLIPEHFGQTVLPWGTTTACSDPHEIANVCGLEGIRFMLESAGRSPLRHYMLAPSCVPSVPAFERAGASFGAAEIAQLLDMPGIIGVAELMDTAGVYQDDPRMKAIIAEGEARGVFLQGHAVGAAGKELIAYRLGGPESDHESITGDDVRARLRAGLRVNLRAGSISDTLKALVTGCGDHLWRDLVSVCTDDKNARDILATGHINAVVAAIIGCGVHPVEAYKLATLNAAREYRLDDLGAVAPGYLADMQLVRELDGRRPEAVFIGGRLVARDGRTVGDFSPGQYSFPNTVNIPQVTGADIFRLRAPEGCGGTVDTHVVARSGDITLQNGLNRLALPVRDGYVSIEDHPGLCFVAVVNRYGSGGATVAVYQDFGLLAGAFATTVSHDCHNLTVVYRDPADALVAARTLEACGGGMCVVRDGAVAATLPLPAAGLMSALPADRLAPQIDALEAAYRTLRADGQSVMKAVTLSLPCTPRMVVTDLGLVDGTAQAFAEIFPAN